jgi:hypothetical protein
MALARLTSRRDALRRLDPARALQGPRRHDPGGLRGRRRPRRGQDDRRGAPRARGRREPPARARAAAVHREHDGDGLRGARHLADGPVDGAAQYPSKAEVAYEAGKLVVDVLARGLTPRDIITREALENAIAAVTSSGGSTNGVLHLLAVAREAGVELSIDDFDAISEKTPLLCDLKPGGKYVAVDLHEAGGVPVLVKRLRELGILHATRSP